MIMTTTNVKPGVTRRPILVKTQGDRTNAAKQQPRVTSVDQYIPAQISPVLEAFMI